MLLFVEGVAVAHLRPDLQAIEGGKQIAFGAVVAPGGGEHLVYALELALPQGKLGPGDGDVGFCNGADPGAEAAGKYRLVGKQFMPLNHDAVGVFVDS